MYLCASVPILNMNFEYEFSDNSFTEWKSRFPHVKKYYYFCYYYYITIIIIGLLYLYCDSY